jgi:AhpD family alkylhydroperoxidase
MHARLNAAAAAPEAYKAMLALEQYIRSSGLEHPLLELVKLRASQINACAYCIDMHWKDARAAGETEQRLYGLSAWRESPYYTDRERAALAWTESLTLIAQTGAPDADFEPVRKLFTDKDLAALTVAITTINAWNRLAISLRTPPGAYKPAPQR